MTEEEIVAEFPSFFPGYKGNPSESCLAFGLEIGKGWYPLFYQLCKDIQASNPPEDFKFEQIKEKFGGLRVYYSFGNVSEGADMVMVKAIRDLVLQAEIDCYKICEYCSSIDEVTLEGRWIKNLCKNCRGNKDGN